MLDHGLLLGVSTEIPAWGLTGMREQRVYARLVVRSIVLKFNLAGLLPDGEIVLNGDRGAR